MRQQQTNKQTSEKARYAFLHILRFNTFKTFEQSEEVKTMIGDRMSAQHLRE